ncbi:MAG: DsbA family protein [Solirubrobacteraceae bacterium]
MGPGSGRRAARAPRPPPAARRGTRARSRVRGVYDRAMPALFEPVHAGDHVRGGRPARSDDLELVVYGDFECPFCAAAQGILARVERRLGDRLRLVFRHFPLDTVHPHARAAAEAAEATAAQGAFWEMHDALYAARGRLADADLVAHARAARSHARRADRARPGDGSAGRRHRHAGLLRQRDAGRRGLRRGLAGRGPARVGRAPRRRFSRRRPRRSRRARGRAASARAAPPTAAT